VEGVPVNLFDAVLVQIPVIVVVVVVVGFK